MIITKEFLENKYFKEEKSTLEISKEIGLSYNKTRNLFLEYEIKMRPGGAWRMLKRNEEKKKQASLKQGKTIKGYTPWNKGLTKNTDKRVAKGVDKLSIIRKEIFKGEKNPFFGKNHTEETRKIFSLQRGGTGTPYENSKYPIEWNEKLRNKIRERDNYTCKNCGMGQEENIVIYGRDLEVHHIDYNKENTNEDNLITLCLHCHRRTNYNRDYWINFFKIKIW